jgi:ammonium transporter, Amt family
VRAPAVGYVDQRNAGAKAPPSLEVGMHVNAGDTAWMLTSTALVFFMMPGLALFYGGLVRFRGYLVFIGLCADRLQPVRARRAQ